MAVSLKDKYAIAKICSGFCTQSEAARELGIKPSVFWQWTRIPLVHLAAVCRIMHLSLDEARPDLSPLWALLKEGDKPLNLTPGGDLDLGRRLQEDNINAKECKELVISIVGGPIKASSLLGLSKSTAQKWKKIPVKYLVSIYDITGVAPRFARPDLCELWVMASSFKMSISLETSLDERSRK